MENEGTESSISLPHTHHWYAFWILSQALIALVKFSTVIYEGIMIFLVGLWELSGGEKTCANGAEWCFGNNLLVEFHAWRPSHVMIGELLVHCSHGSVWLRISPLFFSLSLPGYLYYFVPPSKALFGDFSLTKPSRKLGKRKKEREGQTETAFIFPCVLHSGQNHVVPPRVKVKCLSAQSCYCGTTTTWHQVATHQKTNAWSWYASLTPSFAHPS